MASQWRMMWWKLRRHRLAVVSGGFLALLYASVLISELIAPYALATRHTEFIYAPPQSVHLFHEGRFVGPHVLGLDRSEEHTSELQSLMRISYAVFCLKKQKSTK